MEKTMYKLEELTGKQRKVGGEAPSARVFAAQNDEMIIGMMAVNVQLLVSVFSLKDENSKIFINTLEEKFKTTKKLNLIILVKNSFEDITTFQETNNITKTEIAQDTNGDFAKRFGVDLESENYQENLGNAAFVIDKEAELKYVSYPLTFEANQIDEIYNITIQTVNFKEKGHSHENWMGV
jgi:thiol peroxidase